MNERRNSSERLLQGRRVLVVEDQYYLATDIAEWLAAAGAEVVGPAPDADKACELLKTQPVDSGIVDINLGQGPSFDVASRLTEHGVPFLFATGYDQIAIPETFERVPRLEKPFNGAALVHAVRALEGRGSKLADPER